ncbi:hypothetical protein RUM44_002144 [Polyplax serrata]|uniref:Arf-GAP domain-containing protein n=1 Tax=Polyplax serrata TaxID=468196 RepID=A0ABR1AM19_POLSC
MGRNESKAEKDRQKQIQDKCQTLLTQMLRDEDNKYCVDCDAKGPRWASWNLGVFLCIRCAGIHRNLGVHISKVKSVNLDSWTPEQVVSLQQMGNSRARAVYEATLPDSWRRPQTDSSLENFIRAKYQHKRYIAKEWVPPPLPKVDWEKELDEEADRQKKRKKEKPVPTVTRKPLADTTVPALPKPNSSPKASRTKIETTNKSAAAVDLLGLNSPTTGSLAPTITNTADDVFSNFLSAPPASSSPRHDMSQSSPSKPEETTDNASTKRTAEEESFFNQPTPSAEKKQLSKDSILALYGSSNQQPSPMFNNTGLYQQTMNSFQQVNPYPNGVNQPFAPPAQPTIQGSNPFFNMCGGQLPNQFPFQSPPQHANNTVSSQPQSQNGDLLGDFNSTGSSQLTQQMSGLNLNQSRQPVAAANPFPPMSTYPGEGYLSQPPNANQQMGQTFTMHLWQ